MGRGERVIRKQAATFDLGNPALITEPQSWIAERLSKVEEDRSAEFLKEPSLERRGFRGLLRSREGCGRQQEHEPCPPASQEIMGWTYH